MKGSGAVVKSYGRLQTEVLFLVDRICVKEIVRRTIFDSKTRFHASKSPI